MSVRDKIRRLAEQRTPEHDDDPDGMYRVQNELWKADMALIGHIREVVPDLQRQYQHLLALAKKHGDEELAEDAETRLEILPLFTQAARRLQKSYDS